METGCVGKYCECGCKNCKGKCDWHNPQPTPEGWQQFSHNWKWFGEMIGEDECKKLLDNIHILLFQAKEEGRKEVEQLIKEAMPEEERAPDVNDFDNGFNTALSQLKENLKAQGINI